MAAIRPQESHEHLLGANTSTAGSSRPGSFYSYADSIDSRIKNDAPYASYPKTSSSQTYRGFPSREAYLAALRDWAESKTYQEPHQQTLTGFYGKNTMEYYRSLPKLKGDRAARKEAVAHRRRNTVTNITSAPIPEEVEAATQDLTKYNSVGEASHSEAPPKEGRVRRLSRSFKPACGFYYSGD